MPSHRSRPRRVLLGCGLALFLVACVDESAPEPVPTPPTLACNPGQTRACYEGPEDTAGVGSCRSGVQACLQHGRGWGACAGQVLPQQENCDTSDDDNCDGLASCGQTLWAARLGAERDEVVSDLAADAAGSVFITGYYRDPIELGGAELPVENGTRDLFVAKLDADGGHVWSRGLYGNTHHQPRGVAATGAGDAIVIIANVSGEVLTDGATIDPPRGAADVLLVKLHGDGTVAWTRRFGDEAEQVPTAVAFDAAGNVVVTGYFDGELDFGGPEPLTSAGFNRDVFVVKLDPDGDELWSRAFNAPLDQLARALAVGPDGTVWIAGGFSGTVDFGGGPLVAEGTTTDAFLVALGADGEHLHSERWGGSGNDQAWAVAAAADGEAVVAGRFEAEVRFGGALLRADAAGAIFVARVDTKGEQLWAQRIGGASEQGVTDLALDARGRAVLTGYYEGDVPFGVATLPPSGLREPNILVAKLEPNGDPVWARGVAVDGNQAVAGAERGARSVAVLPGDFIAIGGFVQGSIDLGDGPLAPLGGADLLVAKLAP